MAGKLLSIRAYAKHRGCSHVAVMKALKAGRIALTEGKIDAEAADAAWSRNTDPAQQRASSGPPGGQTPAEEPPPAAQMGGEAAANYARSRAVRETYRARLTALDYRVRAGELVEADAVRARAFKLYRTARDMLLALPERLAPLLAGTADQYECHRILREELERVCNELANADIP